MMKIWLFLLLDCLSTIYVPAIFKPAVPDFLMTAGNNLEISIANSLQPQTQNA